MTIEATYATFRQELVWTWRTIARTRAEWCWPWPAFMFHQSSGFRPLCGPRRIEVCLRCKVEMKPGKAFENTLVGYPDFPGDTGMEPGSTLSRSGPARLVDCLKCPQCGNSIKA